MKARFRLAVCLLSTLVGCNGTAIRSQSPEDDTVPPPNVKLVGDLAVPFGMFPLQIESVALVTNLSGTGSDPRPSPQRAALLDEMQKRGVVNPNHVLADPTTSMVIVRGLLRPGIQKGDHFDIEVRIPSGSETSSLRGGWLMQTRLRELRALDRIREGKPLGLGEGAVLVDPSATAAGDKVKLGRGRVLGGGVALESRPLGLVLKPDNQTVRNSAMIGTAVNRRFPSLNPTVKKAVANPQRHNYIELAVHPRYKDNVERYMLVVRAVPVHETPSERLARLAILERQLLDPLTSATAAIKLEAIGKEGVETLRKGLKSKNLEARFYAAEALAYLDQNEAAAPLAEIARDEPAFRVFALTALSAMDDVAAEDALRTLLDVKSAETRYGAFRALWAMNPHNRLLQGENLGGQFSYHVLKGSESPMIHVTRSYRPEIVLFGGDQRFQGPLSLEAGPHILLNSLDGQHVTVSRFSVNDADQKRIVGNSVDECLRAIVELGGTYPDVVQLLQESKTAHVLASRFEVDAVPHSGRTYDRPASTSEDELSISSKAAEPRNPTPGLFAQPAKDSSDEWGGGTRSTADESSDKEKTKPGKSFLGRLAELRGR